MKTENKAEQRQLITQIGDLFEQHTQYVSDDCPCALCKEAHELGKKLASLEEKSEEKAERNKIAQHSPNEFLELSLTMKDEDIAELWEVTRSQLKAFKRRHELHSVEKGLTKAQKEKLIAEVPARRAKNETIAEIAREYGIAPNTLTKLMTRSA